MPAADIDEAIAESQAGVNRVAADVARNLWDAVNDWEATFLQFNDTIEAERTVRNWKVPAHRLLALIPNANQDQSEHANDTFLVVYGATCAVKYAAIDGRITGAQQAIYLAAWNNSWGA
jgi:hypothetical protein